MLLELVMILFKMKLFREGADELLGQLDLLRAKLDVIGLAVARSFVNLVGEVHGVQREAVVVGTEEGGVFALVHGQLGNAHALGILQCFQEQPVSLSALLFWYHKVGGVK